MPDSERMRVISDLHALLLAIAKKQIGHCRRTNNNPLQPHEFLFPSSVP